MKIECKCGSRLFERSYRCGGWWVQSLDDEGNVIDTDLSGVRIAREPKTISCAECGRRIKNPKYTNG